MKLSTSLIILLLIPLLASLSCSKNEDEYKKLALPFRHETNHFKFYYDSLHSDSFLVIAKQLEETYDTIIHRLKPGSLPKISVAIWFSKDDFNTAMNNRYPGATGYVYNKEEIRVLYVGINTASIAVHEFVHAVTMFLSEGFANNPRWLWEAVALYESKQFIDPKRLSYMVSGNYPAIDVLNSEWGTNQRIYEVGYTLAEFIVHKWGYEGLRSLIKSHGELTKTLGVTKEAFQQQWFDFVKAKYL